MVLSLLQTLTCALIASDLEPFPSCLFQPRSSLSRCRPHTQLQRRRLRLRSNTHLPREGPRRHVAMVHASRAPLGPARPSRTCALSSPVGRCFQRAHTALSG